MTEQPDWSATAGLDLGGTAIRAVIRQSGVVVATRVVPTASFDDAAPARVMDRLAELIRGLLPRAAMLSAVGIGASGPVDRERGLICNEYTLPRFSGFALVAGLEARLGCRVVIDNDAMTAAFAEYRIGAGQRSARMLMVTLGTGIGVALLVSGQPFRGLAGAHPEGGHISVRDGGPSCYCGAPGCWEQAASRTALRDRLAPLLAGTPAPERLIDQAAAQAAADPAIKAAFQDYGRLVGRGLAVLHTLYMPDVTIIGGSAGQHLGLFGAGLDEALARVTEFFVPAAVRVAVLGEAGAVGAALMAESIAPDGPAA